MASEPTTALSIPILNPATRNIQFNATLTTSTEHHRILRSPPVRDNEDLYRIELKLETPQKYGGGSMKIYWNGKPKYTDWEDFYISTQSVTRYIRSDGRIENPQLVGYLYLGHGDRIQVDFGSDRDEAYTVEFTFNVASPTFHWQMSGSYPGQNLVEVFGGYVGPIPVNTASAHGQHIPQGQTPRGVSNHLDRAVFEHHYEQM